jgi:hypothetical protein
LQIGDFGCGEAKLLEAFGDNRVYSFNDVAINDKVKACDIMDIVRMHLALAFSILEL